MSGASLLYFAYGSNLLTRRLRAADRAPSARRQAIGYVEGRRLAWDKLSVDGSGKCDLEAVDDPAERTWGVVFRIAAAELPSLDRAEGLGFGYRREEVEVVTGEGRLSALTYVAEVKRPGLLPFRWYHQVAVAGAEEHALPEEHLARMRRVGSTEDPDAERDSLMRALLDPAK